MLIYLQTIDQDEYRDKFERLYARYKGMMFRIAMGIFHNREDAEDVVHQSFTKIIEYMDRIEWIDGAKTRSFVITVCKHCSIDLLRKRKQEVSIADVDELELPIYTAGDELADAFRRLKPEYREVLLLRYHFGYGTSDIAHMTDLSYEAVRKRLQAAKKMLQELLNEGGELHA